MRDLSIKKRVRGLILTLYTAMVLTLLLSLGVALHQNWQLKLQSSRNEMARQAGIGNFIIEHAIINAAKALARAQQALQKTLAQGPLNTLQTHDILQDCLDEHNAFINSDYKGLMLFMDAQGVLQARTDHHPSERLDFSNQIYFQQLREHPASSFMVGPLLKAQTTGEWVFHVAVPLLDQKHTFHGVLAQQIRLNDITQDLRRYVDTSHTAQIVTQTLDGHLALVYPSRLVTSIGHGEMDLSYADFARRSSTPQDAFVWPVAGEQAHQRLLVGFELSEHFHLLTTAHRTLPDIVRHFVQESLFLLGISVMAWLLLTLMLVRLSRVYDQFADALHDSFSDALTHIPNRRALENILPRLLRDGIRTQDNLSVLFIDIDHFKRFNDDYGHDGGDIALKAVAQTLLASAHRPLDFVCRWGGEEFVVLLPHTTLQAANAMAEDMMEAVRRIQLTDHHGHAMRQVSVSVGVASAVISSTHQGEQLILDADAAMQAAKQAGRNRAVTAMAQKT